jgi:hypothetical protein
MPEQAIPVEAEFTLLKKQLVKIKRRASVRYRCNLATLGRLLFGNGDTREAWAQNLSDRGIGLSLASPLPEGTQVVVRLSGHDQRSVVCLEARVVHATQQVDGSWRVGCEFSRQLTCDEMEALL